MDIWDYISFSFELTLFKEYNYMRFKDKYTALHEEIEMHKPDTSWHKTLIAVVIMVAVCWGILMVTSLMSV